MSKPMWTETIMMHHIVKNLWVDLMELAADKH
jgi:hypothetical protein